MRITSTQWGPWHVVNHTQCLTVLLHRPEAVMLVVAVEQHLRRSRSILSSPKAGERTRLREASR